MLADFREDAHGKVVTCCLTPASALPSRCEHKSFQNIGSLKNHLSDEHGETFTTKELEVLLRARMSPGHIRPAARFRVITAQKKARKDCIGELVRVRKEVRCGKKGHK